MSAGKFVGRVLYTPVVAAASLLIVAAPAGAATTFGADLSLTPTGSTSAFSLTNVTDPGGAADTGAPISGILTSVRIKTTGEGGSGVVRVLTLASHPVAATYNFTNDAPEIPVSVAADATAEGHITQVLTRRPIAAGQHLGWYVEEPAGNILESASDTSAECAYTLGASGSVAGPGTTYPYTTSACNHEVLLVAGTIEADADHDGYGDDSQDKCVQSPGPFGGCPSTVSIERARQTKKKPQIKVFATVPGAGALDVGPPSDHAHPGTATRPVIRAVHRDLTSTTTQRVSVTLKLTKLGKHLLAAKGKLKARVEVSYTPPGGPTASASARVRLKSHR
jgi:hypothetical protein